VAGTDQSWSYDYDPAGRMIEAGLVPALAIAHLPVQATMIENG
jgi:hypothetical protein